jgi:hypothetical protein
LITMFFSSEDRRNFKDRWNADNEREH